MNLEKITWKNNITVASDPGKYVEADVKLMPLLAAWRNSIVASEWIMNGHPKQPDQLHDIPKEQYARVLSDLETGRPLDKPLLGLGLFDNLEVVTGRAVVYAALTNGFDSLPVQMPAADQKKLEKLLNE